MENLNIKFDFSFNSMFCNEAINNITTFCPIVLLLKDLETVKTNFYKSKFVCKNIYNAYTNITEIVNSKNYNNSSNYLKAGVTLFNVASVICVYAHYSLISTVHTGIDVVKDTYDISIQIYKGNCTRGDLAQYAIATGLNALEIGSYFSASPVIAVAATALLIINNLGQSYQAYNDDEKIITAIHLISAIVYGNVIAPKVVDVYGKFLVNGWRSSLQTSE